MCLTHHDSCTAGPHATGRRSTERYSSDATRCSCKGGWSGSTFRPGAASHGGRSQPSDPHSFASSLYTTSGEPAAALGEGEPPSWYGFGRHSTAALLLSQCITCTRMPSALTVTVVCLPWQALQSLLLLGVAPPWLLGPQWCWSHSHPGAWGKRVMQAFYLTFLTH
jgi:hypothetical protein